jgi:hypothetical protein
MGELTSLGNRTFARVRDFEVDGGFQVSSSAPVRRDDAEGRSSAVIMAEAFATDRREEDLLAVAS